MSLQFIERIAVLLSQDLASESGLGSGEELGELEAKYLPYSEGIVTDRDDVLKSLLISVAKEGVKSGKVDLSLCALNKLDPSNPLNLLNLNSKSPTEKAEYISNYLQINTQEQPQENFQTGKPIKHSDEVGDWKNIGLDKESAEIKKRSQTQEEKNLEEARNNEIEENFREAFASFELSGVHDSNFLRVSIKHSASNEFLEDYCRNRPELRLIWLEYILELGQFDKAISFCEKIGEDDLSWSLRLTKQVAKSKNVQEFLHPDIREFALADESKWNNIKQLDRLVSLCDSLKGDRSLLAELTSNCLLHNNVLLAMSVAMSLDRAHLILDQFLAMSSNIPVNLNRISSRKSSYCSTLHLLHHLSSAMRHDISLNGSIMISACIHLGLVDDLLQLWKYDRNLDEIALGRMIEVIEKAAEFGSQGAFDTIDPTLHEKTTTSIMSIVKQENRSDVNIQLVTLMILSIDIFLMKLDTGEQTATIDGSILNLERMFSLLADNLDGLTLTASDGLFKSTNSLVNAIKNRLDALADSEIIRTSFIKIVDTVAGLCLIDARYKSAAILYSQIEDNVNAIKALMRTGEAETVMNYALLVRDITVNRITINYIKHLRLEPEVIENFIKQSKL